MDTKTEIFLAAWFGAVYTSLIFSLALLVFISTPNTVNPISSDFKLYAALPAATSSVSDEIDFQDGRAAIIEDFFKQRNSQLANEASVFIAVADAYKLDYRLLPAIAMQESNGGKKVIRDSYNPFGYGIYENKAVKFASWEEAIRRVGRALKEDYLDQGLKTPGQIMIKYTPPSLAKGGAWAKGVSSFMAELR